MAGFRRLVPELSVSDITRSLDFYVRILGFALVYARPEEGFAFIELDSAQLMLDQIGEGRTWATGALDYPLGRGINFEIEVASIAPLLERLREHGLPLFLEPEEKWYRVGAVELGNRQFLVQDPDGYLLRFAEDMGERSQPD